MAIFNITLLEPDNPDTITLYYRTNYDDPNKNPTYQSFKFLYNITDNLSKKNNYYAGCAYIYMMDSNGIQNNDIISFSASETRPTTYQDIPYIDDIYNENVMIRLNYNQTESLNYDFIHAQSVYNNFGIGSSMTTISVVTYYVTTSSGKFDGYKRITIYFDNINNTRIVKINK
jgi:hypothetical protein